MFWTSFGRAVRMMMEIMLVPIDLLQHFFMPSLFCLSLCAIISYAIYFPFNGWIIRHLTLKRKENIKMITVKTISDVWCIIFEWFFLHVIHHQDVSVVKDIPFHFTVFKSIQYGLFLIIIHSYLILFVFRNESII